MVEPTAPAEVCVCVREPRVLPSPPPLRIMADAEQLAKALVVGFLNQEDHKLAEKAGKKLGTVSSRGCGSRCG